MPTASEILSKVRRTTSGILLQGADKVEQDARKQRKTPPTDHQKQIDAAWDNYVKLQNSDASDEEVEKAKQKFFELRDFGR